MSAVLAVLEHGTADRPIADAAAAIAAVMSASVRRIDLTSVAEPARKVDRVLTELGEATSVLGVLSGAASLQQLGWPVLQRARKPVVLVPSATRLAPQMISRALIPLDGTPESAIAVAETIRLLAGAGVDLVVLHVFDATTVPRFWDQPAHAEQAWQNEFLARYCDQPGVRLQLRSGVPGEHVLDVAASEHVDLIALGWSRQLGEARARTLRHTLREARVPVLVVPIVTPLSGRLLLTAANQW
jgi:nucleotide-binding universal stress UspA family protein